MMIVQAAASSKVIKSVAQRELERMMWMFKKMYLQAWVTYLNDKKSILARLRQRLARIPTNQTIEPPNHSLAHTCANRPDLNFHSIIR
jgi:hypothetical protein